jgi:hypothetical protein
MSDSKRVEIGQLEKQLEEHEHKYITAMKAVSDAKEALTSAQTLCLEHLQHVNRLQRQYLIGTNQHLAQTNTSLTNQIKVLTEKVGDDAIAELHKSSLAEVKLNECKERDSNLSHPV